MEVRFGLLILLSFSVKSFPYYLYYCLNLTAFILLSGVHVLFILAKNLQYLYIWKHILYYKVQYVFMFAAFVHYHKYVLFFLVFF